MSFNPLDHPIIFNFPPGDLPAACYEHAPFGMYLISALRPSLFVQVGAQENSYAALGYAIKALNTGATSYVIKHSPGKEVLTNFSDHSIELLSFDLKPGCELDTECFRAWLPKLSVRSIVLFHNIHNINITQPRYSAAKLWQEVKGCYPSFEFPHGNGLGVLAVNEEGVAVLGEIFNAGAEEKQRIREFFSALSDYHQRACPRKREQPDAETVVLLRNQLALSESAGRELQRQLTAILNSRAWRVMQNLWRVRRSVAPPGSLRLKLLYAGVKLAAYAGRLVKARAADNDEYHAWIAAYEPGEAELQKQRELSSGFTYRPLINIITPVYNTPPELLRTTVQSVLDQTYPHWQLCLVDGGSSNEDTWDSLCRWAEADDRIIVKRLAQNLGISGNSNAALEMAEGEFVALLDHDDLLAPNALFEVVELLNKQPEADFIYSDRDFISEDGGRRFEPIFKPGWSPEILMSANYLCHFTVVRRTLVATVGGFDPAMDGAQDWDFFFRLTEATDRVAHIPKVLYHWRQWGNSSSSSVVAKPYVLASQKRAVCSALQRKGLKAEAEFGSDGHLRVIWPLASQDKVSVVISPRSNFDALRSCLSSLVKGTNYRNFEVLISSPDLSERRIAQLQQVAGEIPLHSLPFIAEGGTARDGRVLENATGKYLLFLSGLLDAITADWMEEMLRWAQYPGIGVVGAKLLGRGYKIEHAGIVIGDEGIPLYPFAGLKENEKTVFGYAEWYRNWSAVSGDCLLISRELFQTVGGFGSPRLSADDGIDLCLKVRASGLRVLYTPYARLKYRAAVSRPSPVLEGGQDPFYNRNLSPVSAVPRFRER